MIKIIKKKINMIDELKTKIDCSCKFSKQKYKIYEGCLRIVEHTNLEYVGPYKVIINNHSKQYLPYSIMKEITKLDEYSSQIRFMKINNIEPEEDLNNFSKTISDLLNKL